MTTVGGLVKHFVNNVLDEDDRRHKKGHRKWQRKNKIMVQPSFG
jgi:hypothetical protein